MKKVLLIPRFVSAAAILVSLLCSKPVPVRELSDARLQLAQAEKEKAPEYAPASYASARAALLEAHKSLADENYDEAAVRANAASNYALKARVEAAPKYAASLQTDAEGAFARADEAYAEELASDDYQAAKKLLDDGKELMSKISTPTETDQGAMTYLEQNLAAERKFEASRNASTRARNVALSQSADLLNSLSGAKTNLMRAEQYGARENLPDQYAQANREVEQAGQDIAAGKLKAGNAHIVNAEKLTQSLLTAAYSAQAQKKKAEAERLVREAGEHIKNIDVPEMRSDKDKAGLLKSLKEQYAAAMEALNSANENYSKQKLADSIQDSEEAIRLAQIINEQSLALEKLLADRGNVANRNTTVDPNDPNTNNTNNVTGNGLPEGWKKYVVRRSTPVECLWRIAQNKEVYADGRLWPKIYRLNRRIIHDPNRIYPGMELLIPPRDFQGDTMPAVQ